MRRSAFAAGFVAGATFGVTVGLVSALADAVVDLILGGSRGDREEEEHPIDVEHHIDLTDAYEAHATPHVEEGNRDGLVWVPLSGAVWVGWN